MSSEGRAGTLTCRELIEFLHRYLDGELAPEVRARFEEHLRECPPCGDYLASYRATMTLAADAFADDAEGPVSDDEVPEELVRAVLAARARGR
jgi:anti-sigma factor RsiW